MKLKITFLLSFLVFFSALVFGQNTEGAIPNDYNTRVINAKLAYEAKCQAAKLKKSRAESAAKEAAKLQEDAELELLALQSTQTEFLKIQFEADFKAAEKLKAEIEYETALKIAQLLRQQAFAKAEAAAKFNLKYNIPITTKTSCE